jgi:hypothetical protein
MQLLTSYLLSLASSLSAAASVALAQLLSGCLLCCKQLLGSCLLSLLEHLDAPLRHPAVLHSLLPCDR